MCDSVGKSPAWRDVDAAFLSHFDIMIPYFKSEVELERLGTILTRNRVVILEPRTVYCNGTLPYSPLNTSTSITQGSINHSVVAIPHSEAQKMKLEMPRSFTDHPLSRKVSIWNRMRIHFKYSANSF